jgi:hypothetical protein
VGGGEHDEDVTGNNSTEEGKTVSQKRYTNKRREDKND